MTSRKLRNIAIPNQSTFDSEVESGLTKLQVVNERLYTSNKKVAFKDEFSDAEEKNPVYTYTAGDLSRIDYESGNYKVFTYSAGNLSVLDFVKGSVTYRKSFSYDVDGNLLGIVFTSF